MDNLQGEESGGEENNREVRDDPLESSSLEGRVKSEGAIRDNESSSEESIGEENNTMTFRHLGH